MIYILGIPASEFDDATHLITNWICDSGINFKWKHLKFETSSRLSNKIVIVTEDPEILQFQDHIMLPLEVECLEIGREEEPSTILFEKYGDSFKHLVLEIFFQRNEDKDLLAYSDDLHSLYWRQYWLLQEAKSLVKG